MAMQTLDDALARANASKTQPVVFIHGLWLKPSSWDRWGQLFEATGYATLAPGWPAEVGGAMAPETIGAVAAHFAGIARALDRRPAIIGHSLGGLIAQMLAERGLSAVTVAVDPAPFGSVLSARQFRDTLGGAVSGPNWEGLYSQGEGPALGMPISQAGTAHQNPWTAASADTTAVRRRPLLKISGKPHDTLPSSAVRAAHRLQNWALEAVTEFKNVPGRGYGLTIDAGWKEVADIALAFVERFACDTPCRRLVVGGASVRG